MKKNYGGSFRFQTRIIQLLNMERNCVWHHEQQEQQMRQPCQLRSWMGRRQSIHDSHPSETANQCQFKTHFNVFTREFADRSEMLAYFSLPFKECLMHCWQSLEKLNHGLSGFTYTNPFNWYLKFIFNKPNIILCIDRQLLKCSCIRYVCVPSWESLILNFHFV